MRPFQNNKKVRRSNNGRRGGNPMSKSYESSGPDVKIRGTASHIAEKYMSLARDAQSSGDSVMSENYLQHAEHYFRIIAGYQQQNPSATNVQPSRSNQDNDSDESVEAAPSDETDTRSERDERRDGERSRPKRMRSMRNTRGHRNNHDHNGHNGHEVVSRPVQELSKDDQPDVIDTPSEDIKTKEVPLRRSSEKRARPPKRTSASDEDMGDGDFKPQRSVSFGDSATLPGFVSTAIPRLEGENS